MADINSDAIVQSLSIGQSAAGAVTVAAVASQSLSISQTAGSVGVVKGAAVQRLSIGQTASGKVFAKLVGSQSLGIVQSARIGPMGGLNVDRVAHVRRTSRTVKARGTARVA